MRLAIKLTVFSLFFFLGLCGLSAHAQNQGSLSPREMDSLQALYRSQFLKLTDIKNKASLFSSGKSVLPGPVKKNLVEKILSRPNAICYDSSNRLFIKNDSVVLYSYTPAQTADGHLLISGEYIVTGQYQSGGFLIKTDYDGNTLWTKLYDSSGHTGYHYITYYKILELTDGSILMAGATSNQVTQNDDLIITKTDPSGNIIWERIFKSRIWGYGNGSTDYFYVQDMKEDPFNGDLYFCGPHWVAGKALIKINSANGDIVWSNLYQLVDGGYGIFDTPFGLDIRQNEIRYFGKFLYSSGNAGLISILRINKQTGDTIQFKIFKSADTAGYKVDFLTADKITLLNNGHYALSGQCYGSYVGNWNGTTPLIQAAVAEFDSSLNFVRAYAFRLPVQSNQYNTRITVFPDGSGLFSMLKWYGGFTADMYYVQFLDGQIVKQRKKFYTNEGMPVENLAVKTPDGADMIVRLLGDSINNSSRNEFIKLHPSDTSSVCLGLDDFQTTVYPFQYVPFSWLLDSLGYNVFLESQTQTITTHTTYMNQLLPGCSQVSYCDTLKLTASDTAICLSQPLTITIHKNQDCGSLVPLIYDTTAVNSVIQVNDSTFMLYFGIPWSGYIYGSLQGCTLLKDSVHINVLQAPISLNLGPDTLICPNNSIILNAHSGYASYMWQDGSTDSVYTVTQPGIYFVDTRDACGGQFSDTVIVSPHPPVPLSLGPDRTMCNGDTLHLDAPSGFINYAWSPNYNISSTTAQNVVVSPAIDTAYSLRAEKTAGCFAFDTIRITVYQAPLIQLGADKSFCASDSAVLDAGPGFASYQWSSGQSSQQITVYTTGNYSVTGTTSTGCQSYDTLRILNVYALPVITLNHDSTLCTGDDRVLNAGAGYTSYQWSTGQTGSSITVNTTGVYAVSVIDTHGCAGTDSTRITKMLPLPAGFLPADTAICNYGTMQLIAAGSFNSYIWNNNSSTSSITISQPGWYWLQVQDKNNCIGRDSILVNPKECLKGLYVPTGFTPNNDGKNDLFKPILLGNVKVYQFWIYNRWGQIVFQTTDLSKGWNGTIGGVPQDNRLFIWRCRYQLEGEPLKMAKGTFIVIR